MEEQKIDRRTKEYKTQFQSDKTQDKTQIDLMIENAIPIQMAVFHRTVRAHTGEPESAFFDPDFKPAPKPSKAAIMYYTPHGLVCDQKGKFKIIPLANVSDTIVK